VNEKTIQQIHNEKIGKASDKWSSYLEYYDNVFLPYKNNKINLLEIGIQNGGSLETWATYFKNAEKIIGCDIDKRCSLLKFNDPRIDLIVDNINSQYAYQKIQSICTNLDIVIDDGSHMSIDILDSFAKYFPMLSPNGIYIIEDTHTLYWKTWNDGINDEFNAYIFFKKLIDVINIQFWHEERSVQKYFSDFFASGYLPEFITNGTIESIEFRNSLIIIRKSKIPNTHALGKRLVTGTETLVNTNVLEHHEGETRNEKNISNGITWSW
jgi:hypothetical protein